MHNPLYDVTCPECETCPVNALRRALSAPDPAPDCGECRAEWVNDVVEVLGFYANPDSYRAIGFLPDRPCGEFADDFSEDHQCPRYDRPMPGKRARDVLFALEATSLHPAFTVRKPDPAPVVEAAVAMVGNCNDDDPGVKQVPDRILRQLSEKSQRYHAAWMDMKAAVRTYLGDGGERTCGGCGSCTDQHFSFFCQAARQWTQPSRSGDCPHWTPREEGDDEG